MQIWIANVNDGRLRGLSQTRVSYATGHLAWAPSHLIAYQRPNHRNIGIVDPVSGLQRKLVSDSSGAFYSPLFTKDANHLAAFWFKPPADFGVWLFGLKDTTLTRIAAAQQVIYLRGLSPDGRAMYAQPALLPTILRIAVTGNGSVVPALQPPWRLAECSPAGASRPSSFVCAAFDFVSDVWLIDHVDTRGVP
jgi:hypothetical protein